ncbi:hypothetical protein DBR42_27985 [Pelomonas sp. HMWF004]|nr:hypothetical protein DBR42_27985 [Pelomonas sp. HMWF004]
MLPPFWISIRPTTSAFRPDSAARILVRWRVNSASVLAPRQSLPQLGLPATKAPPLPLVK